MLTYYICFSHSSRGLSALGFCGWILKTEFILGYFDGKTADGKYKYRDFVEERLKSEYDSPLLATVASTFLGSPELVSAVTVRYLGEKLDNRNVPAAIELLQRPSIDEILQKVQAELPEEKLLKI